MGVGILLVATYLGILGAYLLYIYYKTLDLTPPEIRSENGGS